MLRKKRFGILVVIAAMVLLLGACNGIFHQQPTDSEIVTGIQAKLFQDPSLKTEAIHVISQKGVVVLSGTVGTDLEKATAERLASQTEGVKQVIDQLTVAQAQGSPAPASEVTQRETRPRRAVAERHHTTRRMERVEASNTPPAEATAPAAPATSTETATAPAPPPPAPEPQSLSIPAGTVVTVRMIDGIDSARNRPGEEFAASVDSPVVIGERVVIPRGSDARVRLVEAKSAGHMTGRSELRIELVGLSFGGRIYAVESSVYEKLGASRGKRTAETVGGGAALGALIGAIAGHGKGAAIGAAVGAGAGTAAQVATKGQQIKIPSETKLDFTLKTPVTVTL